MSFRRYPAYKDSGVEWLGEVPEHWDIKRVRRIFEIKKRIVGELGFDILSITQQGIKVRDPESNDGQISMDYSKYQLVEPGDFAMNHMDLLTGYVDVSSRHGVTSPDYRVFSVRRPEVSDTRYLLYVFQMGYKRKILYAFGQGSSQLGRWRLPTEAFLDWALPFPGEEEQDSIATFLYHETAKIDALIAEQQRLIELLRERIKALALSGFVVRNGKAERVGRLVDVVSRPVSISESGIYEPLGLYNRGRGLFHKEPRLGAEMGDSDFFFVESGDLIISGQFAWEGAVALAGNDENGCVVSHRYPVLVGRQDRCLTEFLLALLWTDHGDFLLNQCSRGAAGRNRPLNLDLLLKEEIRVPDPPEQEFVRDLVLNLLELDKEFAEQRSLALEYKSALISAAVTGQIDVRGLVPAEVDA